MNTSDNNPAANNQLKPDYSEHSSSVEQVNPKSDTSNPTHTRSNAFLHKFKPPKLKLNHSTSSGMFRYTSVIVLLGGSLGVSYQFIYPWVTTTSQTLQKLTADQQQYAQYLQQLERTVEQQRIAIQDLSTALTQAQSTIQAHFPKDDMSWRLYEWQHQLRLARNSWEIERLYPVTLAQLISIQSEVNSLRDNRLQPFMISLQDDILTFQSHYQRFKLNEQTLDHHLDRLRQAVQTYQPASFPPQLSVAPPNVTAETSISKQASSIWQWVKETIANAWQQTVRISHVSRAADLPVFVTDNQVSSWKEQTLWIIHRLERAAIIQDGAQYQRLYQQLEQAIVWADPSWQLRQLNNMNALKSLNSHIADAEANNWQALTLVNQWLQQHLFDIQKLVKPDADTSKKP